MTDLYPQSDAEWREYCERAKCVLESNTRDARGRMLAKNWPKPTVSNPNFLTQELERHGDECSAESGEQP